MRSIKNKLERIKIAVPTELIKPMEKKLREAYLHKLFQVLDNQDMSANDAMLKYESQEYHNGCTVFVLTGRKFLMTKEIAASHIMEQATQMHTNIIRGLVDYNDKQLEEGPDWRMMVEALQSPLEA